MTRFYLWHGEIQESDKMNRRILGMKHRGCRIDSQTQQSIVSSKHVGDIVYPLIGDTSISNKSEYITPTRERMLNPTQHINLNEVGEDKNIIKRVQKSRHVVI